MISAWKRLISKNDSGNETAQNNCTPHGVQKLDKELQRKFKRGIDYNMKVVIKGDARVGKTSLFMRLKGQTFEENYPPTEGLNVTSIDWNYKATDDVVKIDLWEAIDGPARKATSFADLKTNGPSAHVGSEPSTVPTNDKPPDAPNGISTEKILQRTLVDLSENFDVYRGTHAVILVFDMTKLWTFKYVQAEMPKVPKDIPVLVLANHRDQGHHRTVSAAQVVSAIESLERGDDDGIVMHTEASMKNGFGLKLVQRFFDIPFLKLQRASLLKQLELNKNECNTTLDELAMMQEQTSRDYEHFLEMQTILRRQQADALSPVNSGLRELDESRRESIRNATISSEGIIDKSGLANVKSIESSNHDKPTSAQSAASQKFVNDRLPSIVIGAKCPLPDAKALQFSTGSRNNSFAPTLAAGGVAGSNQQAGEFQRTNKQTIGYGRTSAGAAGDDDDDESESDEDGEAPRANPLVATYQDDLDPDDCS